MTKTTSPFTAFLTAATPIPPSCVSATKFLKTFANLFVLKSSPMCRISRASPMLATRRFRFLIWHYSISTTSSTILKPPLQVRHMQIWLLTKIMRINLFTFRNCSACSTPLISPNILMTMRPRYRAIPVKHRYLSAISRHLNLLFISLWPGKFLYW